jgi:hypothetical protein
MVPPILNLDGSINRGYGSDIEFDAQGEFIGIAADIYRISRDRAFLDTIFNSVVRAAKFIEELCARTNKLYGPETRFHGLLAPSISHEGYSKPSYSYWDNFFALSAWRNCEYLASEIGDRDIAAYAKCKGEEFAANLAHSIRMTSEELGSGLIHGSADREDVDPTSTSIAFEPCRVEDVLPPEFIPATYDLCAAQIQLIGSPGFEGSFTPYQVRNLNAFVSLGRHEDAFRLLSLVLACRRPGGWRHWAEVVWGAPRAPGFDLCMLDYERLNGSYRDPFLFAIFQRSGAIQNQDVDNRKYYGHEPDGRWITVIKSGVRLTCRSYGGFSVTA